MIEGQVGNVNSLADDKKYGKAKKAAIPVIPEVDKLSATASASRADAKAAAEKSVRAAEQAMKTAEGAQASRYASKGYGSAKSKLDQAKASMADPCKYKDAADSARMAAELAEEAQQTAIAEKKRIEEEERKRAEAERLRREGEAEEARRRAEEERLRNFPPSYTVASGDSLWRISGRDKIYKKSTFWPIIFDANGAKIDDPDLIYPGQELSISRGMSEADMQRKLNGLWAKLSAVGIE
jgi:nucleoid-associated protein YgaU